MGEFLQQPFVMAFFSAHQIHFAVFAYAVIMFRLVTRRFTKVEWCLFGLFALLVVLELVQLSTAMGAEFSLFNMPISEKLFGLPRYFNPLAPLLWVWAAYALAQFWKVSHPKWRRVSRAAILLVLGYFLFGMVVPFFYRHQESGGSIDAIVAARRIAPAIRRDYAGPRVYKNFKYSDQEYFTSRRPVVFCDYNAASWFAKGQSMGANLGFYPYKEDYLFLNMTPGANRGMKNVNPDDYDFVAQVRGLKNRWMLFRRKGVPHH